MKSRLILVLIVFSAMSFLAAQAIPGGQHHPNFPPSGNQGSHGYENSSLQQIESRLQLLEALYLPRLRPAEQKRARRIISEIRGLLHGLPGNHDHGYWQIPAAMPMHNTDFANLYARVQNTSFGSDKLRLLRLAAGENHFSSAQIATLLGLISFSSDRLKALEVLYPRCVDTHSNYVILDAFSYGSDKAKAERIMTG